MTAPQLATGHVRAAVRLPGQLDTAAARAAGRMLPGGWHLDPADTGVGPAAVEITLGQAAVTADTDTVRIRLPRATASGSLAYVTYTALERARQQQGKATVHATALLAPTGRAVLLLGEKGAGKTTTALALAGRGWVHGGDDLVVLAENLDDGGMEVWPGKPTAAVRDPHAPLAPKPVRDLVPFAADPAPLGWIVRLAVHPQLPAKLAPAVPWSVNETLRLHELLARRICGLPTPLTGVGAVPYGPVWPLDTPALARWRSHLISRLAACRFDYLHAPIAETAADLLVKETW